MLKSGFVQGDSTVNQLVSIYDTFCKALDENKEVRSVFFFFVFFFVLLLLFFLDISKAFGKVWYRGLIYKLKQAGIEGPLLEWLSHYLKDRKQHVVLASVSSEWSFLNAGVPQDPCLVFINDLNTNIQFFADDTSYNS